MKIRIVIAALAATSLFAGGAMAQNGVGTTGSGKSVCLWSYQIDHTKYIAPQTVLFYLKDGAVWQNTLKGPCPGLNFHGFSMLSHSDQICSNALAIRVIKTSETCALGAFSPYQQQNASHTANP